MRAVGKMFRTGVRDTPSWSASASSVTRWPGREFARQNHFTHAIQRNIVCIVFAPGGRYPSKLIQGFFFHGHLVMSSNSGTDSGVEHRFSSIG